MSKQLMGRLEMHQDTRLLLSHLVQRFVREKVEFVSWAELTAAIGGRDVQDEAGGLLRTARKHLTMQEGIILVAVPGEGLRREPDVAAYLDGAKRHIGRVARRRLGEASAALAVNGMDNGMKVKACTEASLLSAIVQFTHPKARKMIEGRIEAASPKELPTAETIRAQFEK